jgi:hypothetical protein
MSGAIVVIPPAIGVAAALMPRGAAGAVVRMKPTGNGSEWSKC